MFTPLSYPISAIALSYCYSGLILVRALRLARVIRAPLRVALAALGFSRTFQVPVAIRDVNDQM